MALKRRIICAFIRKDRDAKAELNRRSQACEVLTGTGIRVAEMAWGKCRVESAKCRMRSARRFTLHSSFITPHFFGIPYRNRTGVCGFANRRLNYSANGMKLNAGGDFASAHLF